MYREVHYIVPTQYRYSALSSAVPQNFQVDYVPYIRSIHSLNFFTYDTLVALGIFFDFYAEFKYLYMENRSTSTRGELSYTLYSVRPISLHISINSKSFHIPSLELKNW